MVRNRDQAIWDLLMLACDVLRLFQAKIQHKTYDLQEASLPRLTKPVPRRHQNIDIDTQNSIRYVAYKCSMAYPAKISLLVWKSASISLFGHIW